MMAFIANHLWQSTLVAGFAGLFTLAFRRHRAQVRHGIWLAASLKFLVPFALLVGAGSQMGWRPSQSTAATPTAQVVGVVSVRFAAPAAPGNREIPGLADSATGKYTLASALIAAWLAGVSVVLLVWFARWRRVAALVRAGDQVVSGPVFESLARLESRVPGARRLPMVVSRSSFEPGVFGIVRPILLWPEGIEERLTGEQVDAILAHEIVHVRRHDNLVAALHMLVQAACWFHPLVWWIGSRLLDERERACDEAVVAMGSDPRIYAESILRTCQWYVEAPPVCVAGVTGSNLKRRVEQIMTADGRAALTAWTRSLLALVALAGVAVPIAVGVLTPRLRAQTPERFEREAQQQIDHLRAEADRRVAELHRASENAARIGQASPAVPAAAPAGRPAFDVTSVKPNKSGDGRISMLPAANGGWSATNVTLGMLIRIAFQLQDNQIVGGPKWLFEDRFDVLGSGNAPGAAPSMLLPKMQTLLADRFSLVTHTETRELPMFALVRTREDRLGPNLKPSTATDCPAPPPPGAGNPRPIPQPMSPAQMQVCGVMLGPGRISSGHVTLDQIANNLSRIAGSMVVDKTGLLGFYEFALEYAPDSSLAGRSDLPGRPPGPERPASDGPSLFSAVQEQLGLKLESTKGPVSVLVIDRAEQPEAN
jgi:bla regulator protein BlaR1